MGVMRCDRGNCENILCDRYSYKYGYICNECFDELLNIKADISIEDFMNSSKNEFKEDIENNFKYLDEEFKYME